MTRPAAPVTSRQRQPRILPGLGLASGRAALLIAALTAAARGIGFGRQVVFAHTVGNSCLGSAYTTANQVPNIVYDIVLGGARASSQISSALLTWTVLLLAPASAVLAIAAGPVMSMLIPHLRGCSRAEAITVGARMLVIFAPQILLYGLAVVTYGILQAHRRFTGPALAPVLSSLVVIAAYLAFVPLSDHAVRLTRLPATATLMLSAGTTAGVAALAATAVMPALRLGLRLRPALRFPGGVGRRARHLAIVGAAALIAQDASAVVVTRLANGHGGDGGDGAVVLYSYAWQVFAVPYAVLAVPIAVSAFPALSAGEGDELDAMSAAATRAVLLVSWLGAAMLAGAAMAGGWLIVTGVDVIAVELVPARAVVPALGLGNAAGMAASGLALLAAVGRVRGGNALHGVPRAAGAGLAGAAAGAAAGAGICAVLPVTGFFLNAALALVACCCAAAGFGITAYALDRGDLRAVLAGAGPRAAA